MHIQHSGGLSANCHLTCWKCCCVACDDGPGRSRINCVKRQGTRRGLAVSDVRLMNQIAYESVSSHRFALFLVGLFAVLALVLRRSDVRVISYSVNQRMHEFGVQWPRPGPDLMRLVLGQA